MANIMVIELMPFIPGKLFTKNQDVLVLRKNLEEPTSIIV